MFEKSSSLRENTLFIENLLKNLKTWHYDELQELFEKMLGENKGEKSQGNACVWLAQLFPSKKKETIKNSMKKLLNF